MPSCRWRCARTGASSAARRGIWPECGHAPGWTPPLAEFGIEYFFVDTHGLLSAARRNRNTACTGRRARLVAQPPSRATYESSKLVSRRNATLGDLLYREFYRDAGFDVDEPHIRKLLHAGIKTFTGLKYHRITGKTDWKEPYHPSWAREARRRTPGYFMFNRQRQVEWLVS